MGIEESFFFHPSVLFSLISGFLFFASVFLSKRGSGWDALVFVLAIIVLVLGLGFSFIGDSKYETVSSYQADIYTNDKGVFCVNINGIEFPVYANGDEFNVDGITVRNWVGAREPTKLEESFEAIMNHIFRKMSENYRDLFLFSTISKDEELIKRAKKKAFERFFKENSEIMNHLGFDGSHPSELERAFRKELESLKEE
jgi:hypothetical protein